MRRLMVCVTVSATAFCGLVATGSMADATTPAKNGRLAFWSDLGMGGQVYTIKPERSRHAAAHADRRERPDP